MSLLINSIGEVTPRWLSAALGSSGIECQIADIAVDPVGTGQMASSYRLTPTYAYESGAPTTVVAKVPGESESARAGGAAGAYPNEVSFYLELAGSVRCRLPRCFYGEINADASAFVLLLEDLAPRRQGDQIVGCSVEQASGSVRNLAGLHGPSWCDESLFDHERLTRPGDDDADFLKAVLGPATDQFLTRYSGRLTDDDKIVLRDTCESIASWLVGRPERFGLVHGDYRLDNLLFNPADSDDVATVDWQTIGVGLPARDLSYFLGNSLTIEDRRTHDRALVETYRQRLVDYGVTDYSAEQCWDDYRFGHLQGPLITVLGAMYGEATERGDDMFMAMAERSCAAIRDLNTLDLV